MEQKEAIHVAPLAMPRLAPAALNRLSIACPLPCPSAPTHETQSGHQLAGMTEGREGQV
jgi:hypothetical protein